ncbi:High-affinity branched-chain amino acid transport system permease protein LivH [Ureibacillus acetophenoni]
MEWLQQLVNGVSLGSIYALIALGYTMVYGIIKLINFAHGDVFMLGANHQVAKHSIISIDSVVYQAILKVKRSYGETINRIFKYFWLR